MPSISVKSAVLKAAQIEIKALSVNSKQMTLAVFRQLDHRDLICSNGDADTSPLLAGLPWGRVNYHPDKCGDDYEHLHLIWQLETFLYRSTVYQDPIKSKLFNFSDSNDEIKRLTHLIAQRQRYDAWMAKCDERIASNDSRISDFESKIPDLERKNRESPAYSFSYSGAFPATERVNVYELEIKSYKKRIAELQSLTRGHFQSFEEFAADQGWHGTSVEEHRFILDINEFATMAAIEEEQTCQLTFRTLYAKLYEQLSELDLLFIAV